MNTERARIESELEVQAYLQNLRYALTHEARVEIQFERKVDEERELRYRNNYTFMELFGSKNVVTVMRRELQTLTIEEYMRTVKDLRYPNRTEMREFGKVYEGRGDVYIKIRVELLAQFGDHTVFVMSFHFAEIPFTPEMFPYRKK